MSFCVKKERKLDDLIKEIYQTGTTIVAAAGNNSTPKDMVFPALSKYVISVGSVDESGYLATYSRDENVDFVMPGRFYYMDGEYDEGTSVSTVLLSALITKVKYNNMDMDNKSMYGYLISVSKNPNNLNNIGFGQPYVLKNDM